MMSMENNDEKNGETLDSDKLKKEMLKPITKSKTEVDEELKELEVESSGWWKRRWRRVGKSSLLMK